MCVTEMLARKELGGVFSTANKMRNDWIGHAGIVSQSEAHIRNERLLTELQKTREAMGDGWDKVQLVRAIQGKPRPNAFENEVGCWLAATVSS